MKPKRETVKKEIRRLLRSGPVSAGQIAASLGFTRQAAHYHLRRMRESGEIEFKGTRRGRGTRYVLTAILDREFDLSEITEHEAWEALRGVVETHLEKADDAAVIHRYAFTEMMNNAIDHSEGSKVNVRVQDKPEGLELSIADDGVGVFGKIAEARGLSSETDAIGELTKGKVTTDPARHTGEGIFFTSRAVGTFVLESDGWAWEVINSRRGADWSLAESSVLEGTRVTWRVPSSPLRTLEKVFRTFTDEEYAFSKTSTQVHVFRGSEGVLSRSEARRLAQGLEKFKEVVLDFNQVEQVGQGFADELFRVWANAHREVALVPINMVRAVEFMVRKALSTRAEHVHDPVKTATYGSGTVTSTSGSTGIDGGAFEPDES